ncbi:MAG: DUF21 domain-containing protein, partial [Paraprevotella sp.]|nr:DUF21 domain-containing protein [Paraprevotella sp.]
MTLIIIEIAIILLFSAFFSGMEIAFISSNKLRAELDKNDESITSKILSVFYAHPNDFISTLLVGNNIALVVYGILMAEVINTFLLHPINIENEGVQVILQTLISTLIVLVTGEFLPKTLFKVNPNLMLRTFALPAFMIYIILYPISKITSALSRGLLSLFGLDVNKNASEQAFTKIDLDDLIQSSIESTNDEKRITDEIKIFQNALYFSEIKVRDCMVPRTEIEAIEASATIDALKSLFIESGISKIIVYKEDIDHIIGFIHSSEMFNNPKDWNKQIKEIPIV